MNSKNLIVYLIVAWLCPIAFSIVIIYYTPNPYKEKSSYPSAKIQSQSIEIVKKDTSKKQNFHELWIVSDKQEHFVYRSLKPEPIKELHAKIPKNKTLHLVYMELKSKNVLIEIADDTSTFISYDDTMADFASNRNLIFMISALWFIGFNLGFYLNQKSRNNQLGSKANNHVEFDQEGFDKTSFQPFILEDRRKTGQASLILQFNDWNWFKEQHESQTIETFLVDGLGLEKLIKSSRLAASLKAKKDSIQYKSDASNCTILFTDFEDAVQTAKLGCFMINDPNALKQMVELTQKLS